MREPDPETISRARTGDLRAFEALVRDSQADVWRFAYHLTRSRAAADDVVQETFLRVFRAFGSFRQDAKFTSWVFRIARNCAMDHHRRTAREGPLEDDVLRARRAEAERASPGPDASDRLRLAQAIAALPADLREPFVVIEVLGFGYEETSSILGVKVGTLKSRMHRARAALVEALSEEAAREA